MVRCFLVRIFGDVLQSIGAMADRTGMENLSISVLKYNVLASLDCAAESLRMERAGEKPEHSCAYWQEEIRRNCAELLRREYK